ncbi:MAG TPA: hypothetical protein VGY54_09455 [Polyangiaceae bacterium]|jgi:hypothetical protein|nr:hypothetical protein [Polyangiaceae bacterium]
MPHSTRTQALSLVFVAGAVIAPFAVTLGACGIFGGGKPAETAPAASAAGGEEAGAAESASAAEATSAPAAAGSAPEKAGEATPPPSSPGSTKAATKTEPAWATCHEKYKAKGKDPSADVAALAKGCAKASKMKLIGKTLTGKQSDSGPPQSYPLKAEANHCYRVFAQAQESIKNLDVAIKDSSGTIAAQDGSSSPTAIVVDDGAVCFNAKDAATVVVSVGSGSGKYAVQIWGN